MASKSVAPRLLPDQIRLTALQAERLGALSDVSSKELAGLTVAQISDKFRFRIDPLHLSFRKVCGVVVKHDPDDVAMLLRTGRFVLR